MKRRPVLFAALAIALLPRGAEARGPAKLARIGWLTAQRAPALAPYVAAFRTALAEFGYDEGRNLAIEFRYGNDDFARVPALAMELVRLPVDLIVAQGTAMMAVAPLALRVPVVYVSSADPIAAGVAESLARPRRNMTGLTLMVVELNGKRLELLREMLPGLRRVAIIANPQHPGEPRERISVEETGRSLGLVVSYFPARTSAELADVYAALTANPPQAISVLSDGFAVQNRQGMIDLARRLRVPLIAGWSIFADSGALCTYGPRLVESYTRLAYYVDRILKGAKPADLPIEQPTKFEMVLNLKTAAAIGLTVPSSVLLRADRVIE